MTLASGVPTDDPSLDLTTFALAFDAWAEQGHPALERATVAVPGLDERMAAMRDLFAVLFEAGWARHGWPTAFGGLGGTIEHRAAMWEILARRGVTGMGAFEHLEVLAPSLLALARPSFTAHALPAFLSGRELWSQGFSEPDAGSDLASLRTVARQDGDDFVISGRKIWTSWAAHATWCLVLARTGPPDSRHRGLSALIVDLRDDGVEVTKIAQANGTDELAEVTFDEVRVGPDRLVGDLGRGWDVAMHILSNERGTFAWFRHGFLLAQLRQAIGQAGQAADQANGDALIDLAAVTATAHAGVQTHAGGAILGPRAAYTKLLLCAAEQSVHDRVLAIDDDLAVGPLDAETILRRQEYLFSRIVTIYGGSQQMQLDTIAKQNLRLP